MKTWLPYPTHPTMCAVALIYLSVALAACEHKVPLSSPPTVPAAATDTIPLQAALTPTKPAYAGTYAAQDTVGCSLSITITKQGDAYRFISGTAQGQVEVARQGSETYLTFVGLKGTLPQTDIEVIWQDSALFLQNYGNPMNEYTRFGQCDAKYLKLIRQQQ